MNQQNYQHGMYDADPPMSAFAVVSFVAGVFGFLGLPILTSLIAIWAGRAALKRTRANPPTASGDNMAGAGVLMGWIQIWMVVIARLIWILYLGYSSLLSLTAG
jgi:hypothetical protein